MERLTKHNGFGYDFNNPSILRTLQKLGKIEDLEDKLGCPLEVMYKIYQGVKVVVEITYWDSLDEEDKISSAVDIVSCIHKYGFSTSSGKQCYWKLYKKTWWLRADRSE